MNGDIGTLKDIESGEEVEVGIVIDYDGISVGLGDVWIGIEVVDGALRAVLGPRAEIVSTDLGIMVEEAPKERQLPHFDHLDDIDYYDDEH